MQIHRASVDALLDAGNTSLVRACGFEKMSFCNAVKTKPNQTLVIKALWHILHNGNVCSKGQRFVYAREGGGGWGRPLPKGRPLIPNQTINWISLEGTVSFLMVRGSQGLTISTQPKSSSGPKSGLRDWYVLEIYDTALSPLIQHLRPKTRRYQKTRLLKECWKGLAENVPPASAEEVQPYAGTNGPDLHNHGWEGAQHLGSSLVRHHSRFWSEQAPLFFVRSPRKKLAPPCKPPEARRKKNILLTHFLVLQIIGNPTDNCVTVTTHLTSPQQELGRTSRAQISRILQCTRPIKQDSDLLCKCLVHLSVLYGTPCL